MYAVGVTANVSTRPADRYTRCETAPIARNLHGSRDLENPDVTTSEPEQGPRISAYDRRPRTLKDIVHDQASWLVHAGTHNSP